MTLIEIIGAQTIRIAALEAQTQQLAQLNQDLTTKLAAATKQLAESQGNTAAPTDAPYDPGPVATV